MKMLDRRAYEQFYASYATVKTPRGYNSSPDYLFGVADALSVKGVAVVEGDEDNQVAVVGRLQKQEVRAKIGYLRLPLPKPLSIVVAYEGVLSFGEEIDANLLLHSLFAEFPHAKAIHFTKLPADAPLTKRLAVMSRAIVGPREAHHALQLAGGFETFLARYSGKRRQKLRWERKKLEESLGAIQIVTYKCDRELDVAMRHMEEIGRVTYHKSIASAVTRSPVWYSQLMPFAIGNSLRAHIMFASNGPIAYCLCGNYQSVTHVLAMAHRPEFGQFSPGKHLLLHAIQTACEDKMESLDYGFGDAQYKTMFGSTTWYEQDVSVYRNGVHGSYCYVASSIAARLSRGIMNSTSGNLVANIKKRWRRFLQPSQAKSKHTAAEKSCHSVKERQGGIENSAKIED